MSIDIDNAILTRWNAASLNTSIATLYPGDDVSTPEESSPTMPRANYYSMDDPLESESRGTLVKVKQYTFQVFATTYEAAAGYVKSIAAAFLNSENSTSNALQVAASIGKILSTHEVNEMTIKHDDSTFEGNYVLSVRWRKAKAIP